MDKNNLIERTRIFAIRVFKLVESFPKTNGAQVVSYQLLKSSSSVAANYRATCRAKSKADFKYKLKIVEEESDESLFWLTFTKDVGLLNNKDLDNLITEANELVAIFTKSLITFNLNSSIRKS